MKRILYFSFLLLVGCGVSTNYVHKDFPGREKMTLAVIPFENLSHHNNAGMIVAELFMTPIYKSSRFDLQSKDKTRKLLKENNLDPSRLADKFYAAQLGEKLGVEAVMVGSVSEYTYQPGLGQNAAVGLNVRLVEVKSSEVLWAGSYSKVGSGFLSRTSLNNTAQELVQEMVSDLIGAMKKK